MAVACLVANRTVRPLAGGVLLAVLLLGGCGRELMPTPNLYLYVESKNPFADVPEEYRSSLVDVLYATDRIPVDQAPGKVRYKHGRSPSLAFGSCVVEIGKKLTWECLIYESTHARRKKRRDLSIQSTTELGRFPDTPYLLDDTATDIRVAPQVIQAETNAISQLHQELDRRLAITPRKEAYVFVHGFNTQFPEAVYTIAELWHFLGRQGVPIAYSWPAGSGMSMRGYNHDRESGEFTIFHLKQFIKALAACPQLKKIHLISHSRGTDVTGTALRELIIEARAAGQDPRKKWKLANIVLAAPDLDLAVTGQRLSAERVYLAGQRITIYVNRDDKAIGLADWMFVSARRIGQFGPEDFNERLRVNLRHIRRTHIVNAHVHSGGANHDYFRSSPAVSSDLILLLRDDRDPGKENGRPLKPLDVDFWQLGKDYPRE